MEIAKVFDKDSIDKVADNLFSAVSNSVSEVKAMQQRKAAENVQLVIQALKKIESEIQNKFDGVTGTMEKRIANIRDGRNGTDGRDGRDGKDGKPGRDGAPGPRGPAGVAGKDGKDGKDGISVTNAKIDFDGSLIISLSNGREVNVGEVIDPGLQERIKYISNGGTVPQYILDTLTSLQAQITALQNLGAVNYVGTWNATTNSPAITGGTGDKGDYYVVNVAGNTTIDGQSNWGVGDWIIFNGTAWQKVDGGDTGNLTNLSVSGTTTLSALTASQAVFTNASKELVSNAVTGTGNVVMSTSPVLTTPNLGTPSAATLTNATGLPIGTGVSGLGTGVATALAVNTGSSGAFVVNGGALGTPSSGTVTNLTGTASININGTVGATTANSGAFTTLTTSSTVTHNGGTANGVAYLNASKVLTTGSALTFDGTRLGIGTGSNSLSYTIESVGANNVRFQDTFAQNGFEINPGTTIITTSYNRTTATWLNLRQRAAEHEFYVSGSEQMRLTSTGLGIGTSSPATYSLAPNLVVATASSGGLTIRTGSSNYGGVFFADGTTGDEQYRGFIQYNHNFAGVTDYMFFGTSGGTKMTLDSSGNLGIGTSSPAYRLDAALGNPSSSTLGWRMSTGNIGTLIFGMSQNSTNLGTASTSADIYTTAALDLRFGTNSLERMRLDSSGNLGLGVTPSGWGSTFKALQVGYSSFSADGTSNVQITHNAYYDGSNWRYIGASQASNYYQASGAHVWRTAASGAVGGIVTYTQAMTLDASGRLGVGTTSPVAIVDASYGDYQNAGAIRMGADIGTNTSRTNSTRKFGALTAPHYTNAQENIVAVCVDSASTYTALHVGGGSASFNSPTEIQFYTQAAIDTGSGTERARITSGGDLLVGTTSGQVSATIVAYRSTAAIACVGSWSATTSGDNLFEVFNTETTATQRGSIDYNRAGGLTRYNTTSDYRAKDIIGPVQNPGAVIDALKVYEGVMKGATQSRPMLIAHEAQAYAPYAVSGVKDEMNEDGTPKFQQMDVSSLVPLLLAEIQSLRARVAQLESKGA